LHQVWIFVALDNEVESLGEAEEEDDVDDGEGGHVTQDHAVDHSHKRTSQRNGSERKRESRKKQMIVYNFFPTDNLNQIDHFNFA